MMNPYMRRALELATLGRGHVSPNPMVGCVIEHNGRIIGEGWHQRYGEAHAERNAIRSVSAADRALLPDSTVYVTLEPCSHVGKQPPCANLLIDEGVGRVVCCNDDPNPLVAGQGFQKLRDAGIPVETGLMAEQGRVMNARFFTFFEQKRPYVILKWAETTDGFIGGAGGQPVRITGDLANRLVHRWRSEEDAIMVGTNTARADNPRLNTRLWPIQAGPIQAGPIQAGPIQAGPGKNPVRIVLDRNGTLPPDLHLFDGSQPTIVYGQSSTSQSAAPEKMGETKTYAPVYAVADSLPDLLTDLHARQVQSVLVEGGTALLQSFIEGGYWDELRVFRSPILLHEGVKAPTVQGQMQHREQVGADELTVCIR